MKSFSISRMLLIGAMISLMGLAALGFRAQQKDMEGFRESSQESIHWSSAQVEVELSRFIATLGQYSMGDSAIDAAEVNHRFDILWSRTGLFRNGRVGERLREYDRSVGVIDDLVALLEEHEDAVVNVSRENPAKHLQIIRDFSVMEDRLRALSVEVLSGEEKRFQVVRESIRSSGWMTLMVSTAALVIATILVGVMLIENKRYRRMADESANLARKAEAANLAKSRFLTMMSHELRTPMNGVLGLMALAKQSGLSERQRRLIEQAERSGERMIGLLGDILDFSDLQMEQLELEKSAFETEALTRSIETVAEPIIHRLGVTFETHVRPGSPEWIVGDFARLRQSIAHFLTFMVEVVGARDVVLEVFHEEGTLLAEIVMDARDSDEPGWQPEALFGRDGSEAGNIASDSLGPAIARGIISLMGGQVSIERREAGRATLIVSVPAEGIDRKRNLVRIESATDTTSLVLGTVVAGTGWNVWDGRSDPAAVGAVLLETSGVDEAPAIARLRSAHPGAILVAIGHPSNPGAYDAVCPMPPSVQSLREAFSTSRGVVGL